MNKGDGYEKSDRISVMPVYNNSAVQRVMYRNACRLPHPEANITATHHFHRLTVIVSLYFFNRFTSFFDK